MDVFFGASILIADKTTALSLTGLSKKLRRKCAS